MSVVNRISEGIHLDNNEYDQPEGTMRYNRNGLIYDTESGRYVWRSLKGTTPIYQLSIKEYFMGYAKIRSRHFIIVLNTIDNYVAIRELIFSNETTLSQVRDIIYTSNNNFNLSHSHPIRSMFGVYENENIQRLYFTDFHNQPRVINLAGTPPITVDYKFIDFVPSLDNGYGSFKFVSELSGGSLKAGVYYFAWRLYKDGYYTDWSYLSSPVSIFNGSPGSTYADYQNVHGDAPDKHTTKGIRFTIEDIDDDYDTIQVAAFYSNDLNSIASGSIIHEGNISGNSITVDYFGGEELGVITISEAAETSLFIKRCKDMVSTGKYNVIANIEEREELDVSTLNSEGKNNKIDVQITPLQYTILLDTREYGSSYSNNTRPLNGTLTGHYELASARIIPMLYHYAHTQVTYNDILHGTITVPAGNYFKPAPLSTGGSGFAILATVIKKYRKGSATAPYNINSDYELETRNIYDEYYNYKNTYFCNKLKGYPAGEKVRFGVLFFDKTGRPFFVRHLNNTLTTVEGITIGPGDTRFPERYEDNLYPICRTSNRISTPYEYDKYTYGLINYFSISGLDITSIRDKISGFSIVRCPIERQNLAYGALGFMYADGNNLYANYSFRRYTNEGSKERGKYVFYTPEDMFGLSEFSIQPGDKLVNRYYMTPFDPDNQEETGLQGYGVRMTADTLGINLYQKFYEFYNDSETGNGARGAEHDILFYTKYRQGDGDEIVVDPRNPSKVLRYANAISVNSLMRTSHITNLGVAVLDIDDTPPNVKGVMSLPYDDPRMLICSLKRPKTTVYGGLSDSALASSTYISTGHYQEINDDVLSDIENNGSYIFNEIEIFGGDTFVCIWDFLRLQSNSDLVTADRRYSHTILTPIESRINLELRDGMHVGKDRIALTQTGAGLHWETGFNRWEEFNYNDGYSTDNPQRHYLPVPLNFVHQSVFDTDIRYSDPKEYGEYEDSFRIFKPLNKYQLDKKFGAITNIKHKFNNLIYWQKECVGYIPIGERALMSNDLGKVIQLGVSGIFERNDQLVEYVGNSNQFGLVESNMGFHWYDSIKKLFVSITNSLQITHESIIGGLDNFFINNVPGELMDIDFPPINYYGISGGFDPKEKMVYITISRLNKIDETIGFSIKDNKFTGFYDFNASYYFNINNSLYAYSRTNDHNIYHFGSGQIGNYFIGNFPRYFTIIVKDDSNIAKIFDTFEIIGNNKFFSYIEYALENGDDITEYFSGPNARYINHKLKYRNKRWVGNFPRILRERMVGGYLKITFVNTETNDARFLQMLTNFREMI